MTIIEEEVKKWKDAYLRQECTHDGGDRCNDYAQDILDDYRASLTRVYLKALEECRLEKYGWNIKPGEEPTDSAQQCGWDIAAHKLDTLTSKLREEVKTNNT